MGSLVFPSNALYGDRTAIGCAEQAIDHSEPRPSCVFAVVTERCEISATPFHIARPHIVEHKASAFEALVGQPLLHLGLAGEERVESHTELRAGYRPVTKNLARTGASGGLVELGRRGELRGRGDDPADDHRLDEFWPVVFRTQNAIEARLTDGAENGGNMAVGQRRRNGADVLRREARFRL